MSRLKERKKIQASPLASVLKNIKLHKFAIRNIKSFGEYTIENRALPDFRDGFKPVQRKILWAMNEAGFKFNGPTKKSAETTGLVMGRYHPHGSSYQVLVNLSWMATPPIATQGNWGDEFGAPAAAERYSECKLSKYAENILLDKEYLPVIPTMPTYTGEYQEPIVLPALLPHLLLNGVEGIAIGVITGMPSFSAKSVLQIIKLGLQSTITTKHCLKYLQIKYPGLYDCELLSDQDMLKEFYETGSGRLLLGVKYTINANQMIIHRFTPHFVVTDAINKLMKIDEVASAENHSDEKHGYRVVVNLKSSVTMVDRGKIFAECAKKLQEGLNLRINLIERVDEDNVRFISTNMPGYINMWIAWRKELEVKKQTYWAGQYALQIKRLELFVLACLNIDKIVPIIKSNKPDVDERLAKALDISVDDAKIILEMTLRRLTGLSLQKLKDDIAHLIKLRKTALHDAKHPAEAILAQLDNLAKVLP